MKLRNPLHLLCLLPLATTLACGAADESVTTDSNLGVDEASAPEGETGIIASVNVGYGTVNFHEQNNPDGTVATAVSEVAPANYGVTPLAALFAQGHTNLEVFMALLPNEEAPQSFTDAHPAQATELGRTDEINVPTFDADAPIEKSVSWCKGIAAPANDGVYKYTYSGALSLDDTYGSQVLTLNAGTKAVAPAICNESSASKTSSHTVKGRVKMKKNGGSYDNPPWTPSVAPGSWWHWHGLQLMQSCTPAPGNFICVPSAVDASYQIQGKSDTASTKNTYDLYITKIATAALINPPVVK